MPKYRGRDICDWCDDIARLKRDGDLDAALELATGCMDAMVRAAESNHENVMEHYVREVAIIQHRMKAYADEARMLHAWLSRGYPAPRQDFRIDLHKRLAKANELVAKAEGRDASQFTAKWKRYVELEKRQKQNNASYSAPSSGRSLAHPEQARPIHRSSTLIPSRAQLLQNSFVAMDFETANRNGGASACQITLVRVEGGEIVDRMATLLKPPPAFGDFKFTYLHGISARDVKDAPSWPDIADPVSRFIDGVPVYAHNASFDSGVWRDLDTFFGTQSVPNPFFCSYRTARRYLPGFGKLQATDGGTRLRPELPAGPPQDRLGRRGLRSDRCRDAKDRCARVLTGHSHRTIGKFE